MPHDIVDNRTRELAPGIKYFLADSVRVFGDGNHAELTGWFNELWEEAEDFDQSLIHELRLVFDAEEGPEEQDRLALLSEIFNVPLTARAHRELNNLRRGKITGQALIEQLLRIVRDYSLEEAHPAIEYLTEEAPLIPRIVCSEALL